MLCARDIALQGGPVENEEKGMSRYFGWFKKLGNLDDVCKLPQLGFKHVTDIEGKKLLEKREAEEHDTNETSRIAFDVIGYTIFSISTNSASHGYVLRIRYVYLSSGIFNSLRRWERQ